MNKILICAKCGSVIDSDRDLFFIKVRKSEFELDSDTVLELDETFKNNALLNTFKAAAEEVIQDRTKFYCVACQSEVQASLHFLHSDSVLKLVKNGIGKRTLNNTIVKAVQSGIIELATDVREIMIKKDMD